MAATAVEDVVQEQWVTTTQAMKMLGMTHSKFYRRLKHYEFEQRKGTFDERHTYVDILAIKRKLHL